MCVCVFLKLTTVLTCCYLDMIILYITLYLPYIKTIFIGVCIIINYNTNYTSYSID